MRKQKRGVGRRDECYEAWRGDYDPVPSMIWALKVFLCVLATGAIVLGVSEWLRP